MEILPLSDPALRRGQNARKSKKHSVYKLIIHDHKSGVHQINAQQQKPQPLERFREALVRRRSLVAAEARQSHYQPDIERDPGHSVLDENFEVRIVYHEYLSSESADPAREFLLELAGAPARDRPL